MFESSAWVFIPSQKLGKLDRKAEIHVLVDTKLTAEGHKVYRLLCPETNVIIISRDVKFDESIGNISHHEEDSDDAASGSLVVSGRSLRDFSRSASGCRTRPCTRCKPHEDLKALIKAFRQGDCFYVPDIMG